MGSSWTVNCEPSAGCMRGKCLATARKLKSHSYISSSSVLFSTNLVEGGAGWVSSTCLTPSRIETFGLPPSNTWSRIFISFYFSTSPAFKTLLTLSRWKCGAPQYRAPPTQWAQLGICWYPCKRRENFTTSLARTLFKIIFGIISITQKLVHRCFLKKYVSFDQVTSHPGRTS